MAESMKEIIKRRRSIRTYNGKKLSDKDYQEIQKYMEAMTNPFDVPVEFRMLDAKQHGLTSPVLVGEHLYLAAKVKKVPNFEMAYGYCFEKVCLYALKQGIGTVMLASTINRPAFEKAMDVQEDEVMPLASPLGYAANKMSVRESLMRKGIKADTRKPFDEICFFGNFDKKLKKTEAGIFEEALDMARLAPSAVNAQPWRMVLDGNKVHFFEVKSMRNHALGDIQKVDIGIAMAHFELILQEQGVTGKFVVDCPEITAPEEVYYMVTFEGDV